MVSKKKLRKTLSSELKEATLPKKGCSTFSVVDGLGQVPEIPYKEAIERIIKALESDKNIEITIDDSRPEPRIIVEPNIEVKQPDIKIVVEPTPVEMKVPTQRIPEIRPVIDIKNEMDLTTVCWVGVAVVFMLAADLGLKIWQLQM